jgi:hypothetical protein
MAHDVFVSYSSQDQATALAVVNALESNGVRCWMAPRDIRAGDVWAQAIVNAITSARALVLVFSSGANRSGHVASEVDAAIRKGAIVVPLRIENVMPDGALEFHLRSRHWLDALTPDLGRHLGDLVGTLKALLGQPAQSVPQTEFGVPAPPPAPPAPSKPRPRVEATDSGFHFKVPKPRLPASPKTWKYLAAGVGGLAGLFLVSRLVGGSGSTLRAFEVKEATSGSEFRATIHPRSIRFFESPSTIPPQDNRVYDDSFIASQTRYINTEVWLDLDAPKRELYVPLNCTTYGEGGGVVANFVLANRIRADATDWYNQLGWGRQKPGSWKAGAYRVDCAYGGKVVASGSFKVTD